MTAPSPPPRSPRRTRLEQAALYEHLVQTGLRLFAEGGYEAISMRGLASAVNMPPMSLYRYFPTKAHLIRHIWEHILVRAAESARSGAAVMAAPPQRLRAFVEAFVHYWGENRDHYWIVFSFRPPLATLQPLDPDNYTQFDPKPLFDALSELLDAFPAVNRASAERRQLLTELLVCKIFGYLLGTVGQVMPRSSNHSLLKAHLLDDIIDQVHRFDRGPCPYAPRR